MDELAPKATGHEAKIEKRGTPKPVREERGNPARVWESRLRVLWEDRKLLTVSHFLQ